MKQQWPLDVTVSFDPYFGEPSRDGEQFAEVLPDGRVHFRIIAKDAKEVVIDRFGTIFPLEAAGDVTIGQALQIQVQNLFFQPGQAPFT